MLTPTGCRTRQTRLRQSLDERPCKAAVDAVIIHRPEHLLYLANFFAPPNSLNYHSSSFLLLEKSGESTLFVDNWLVPVENAAVDNIVVTDWYDCIAPAENRTCVVAESVVKRLQSLRVESIAAELSVLPAHLAIVCAFGTVVDVDERLRELRQIKDPDELQAIQRGIRTAEAIHGASRELLIPGLTELEYYSELVARGIVAAEAPFVMMCDLASGDRAGAGGGSPTKRHMEAGELVLLDIFPYVEGYRGDITNTLVVGGQPDGEQEETFELVHEALLAGEALLRPGVKASEIYEAVDSTFRAAGSGCHLTHHAGHAIGLGHPEAPELVPKSDAILAENMVMTLEPGLYGISGGGIRLEHDYLITSNGCQRISHHQLGLI